MHIEVDSGKCQGYMTCVMLQPDVFDLPSGMSVATVLKDEIPEEDRAGVEEAVRSCPTRAIKQKSAEQ